MSNSEILWRLPNIKQLFIYDILEGDKNVQNFLLNVAPHRLEQFIFDGDDNKNRLNVSLYLDGLHAVLNSTTRRVDFVRCSFSSSELQAIFIAAKHLNTLQFDLCKLDVTDEFDITEGMFHIEQLWLGKWGSYSGWKKNIDGLEMLVKAVANSSLKRSLKQIGILEEKKDIKYKVKEIFKRHDLKNVLVQ